MIELPGPVAVVAHDAGAANLILAWIDAARETDFSPFMAGPAERLWRARFPERRLKPNLSAALETASSLITGTGWASDLEHEARTRARAMSIPSIAVLDHWVNYRERFTRHGSEILPDRIWVADTAALARAREAIPEVPVDLRENLYLAEQAASAGPVPPSGDLLFLAEPARSQWGGDRPGEFQSLDFLIDHLPEAGVPADTPVRLRPHPSDAPGKYDGWLAVHPNATLDASGDVAAALRGARYVAGMNSAALQIALASGRTTICALPPNAPDCVLPLSGLVSLRDAVSGLPPAFP